MLRYAHWYWLFADGISIKALAFYHKVRWKLFLTPDWKLEIIDSNNVQMSCKWQAAIGTISDKDLRHHITGFMPWLIFWRFNCIFWFNPERFSCSDFLFRFFGYRFVYHRLLCFTDTVAYLTNCGRVTHICVSKQTIILTNAGILLIGILGTNFSEIWIEIHAVLFEKMYLKMSSGKWRPFCLGLNVLIRALGWGCMSVIASRINGNCHFYSGFRLTTNKLTNHLITNLLWEQCVDTGDR